MKLQKHLVLFHFFLDLLGVDEFARLRAILPLPSPVSSVKFHDTFWDALQQSGRSKLSPEKLFNYQQSIDSYQSRLRANRQQPQFRLKYFQQLAALFSEIYFDRLFTDVSGFLSDLNLFLEEFNRRHSQSIPPFHEPDLHKIAYWMATGSGKTLIMHINYWQVLHYTPFTWDNILLITPNEGMSRQHWQEYQLSGIPAKLYDGNPDNLYTRRNEVLVIDIHKLMDQKLSGGVRVDVAAFEGKNLIFIDEGHKGQKSEEKRWKTLREKLATQGIIIEYSATFAQVIGKNSFLLSEYAKSIIFDFSYRFFYEDRYGKAFQAVNLHKDHYTPEVQQGVLSGALSTFYRQLSLFQSGEIDINTYQLEKPLWVFVGSRVAGKKQDSDILSITMSPKKILHDPGRLWEHIQWILSAIPANLPVGDLLNSPADDRQAQQEKLFRLVFHGSGELEVYEILHGDGELGLKTNGAGNYFGIIHVGNVAPLKKLLASNGIEVKPDYFSASLFEDINTARSPINLLIGAKKFIEGWNSWRVSTMVLMNMGKGEGPQIIQLFGRGVRLKGKDFSLRREATARPEIACLQTLYIYGLNADYMNAFLNAIVKEGIQTNGRDKRTDRPGTSSTPALEPAITPPVSSENGNAPAVEVSVNNNILKKLRVDIRPVFSQITSEGVGNSGVSRAKPVAVNKDIWDVVDWDRLYLETLRFKSAQQLYHLIIHPEILPKILKADGQKIYALPEQLTINTFSDVERIQHLAELIIQHYLLEFNTQQITIFHSQGVPLHKRKSLPVIDKPTGGKI